MKNIRVFSGNASRKLTEKICHFIGVPVSEALVTTFSDGETQVEIKQNVRGKEVFIIQSTCAPVNDHLMELLIMMDAIRRASAEKITAVIPYYGYGRQDRKAKPRVPITAKLVADLITTAGADRVVSMDLHAGQIQGYFNIPVDNIFAAPVLLKYMRKKLEGKKVVVVSPDAGGVERARAFAKRLESTLALADKRRDKPNVVKKITNIIGEVEGKTAIILDDMVDTFGSTDEVSRALKERGALEIYACCTHPVLSGSAIERLMASPVEKLIVTDTIPLKEEAKNCGKIEVLTASELIGETIKRIYNSDSVSTLFV
jgi:ribose-phosphate pyrophosphokinase